MQHTTFFEPSVPAGFSDSEIHSYLDSELKRIESLKAAARENTGSASLENVLKFKGILKFSGKMILKFCWAQNSTGFLGIKLG